jgi:hypothetical protein
MIPKCDILLTKVAFLTKLSSYQSEYLHFSACFLKNMGIIWKENIRLQNNQHFVENKTDYAACLKNAVNLPVA